MDKTPVTLTLTSSEVITLRAALTVYERDRRAQAAMATSSEDDLREKFLQQATNGSALYNKVADQHDAVFREPAKPAKPRLFYASGSKGKEVRGDGHGGTMARGWYLRDGNDHVGPFKSKREALQNLIFAAGCNAGVAALNNR